MQGKKYTGTQQEVERRSKRGGGVLLGFIAVGVLLVCVALVTIFATATDTAPLGVHALTSQTQCDDVAYTPAAQRNIILRVDDIQAFAWNETARRLIDDALEAGIPPSLVTIPVHLEDDPAYITYLKEKRCVVEFALHGYDNQEPEPGVGEFARLSYEEAVTRIDRGLAAVGEIAGEPVVTFVPPLNQLSEGTREVLRERGVRIISSEGEERFDFDAATFDFRVDQLVEPEQVLDQCERAFARGEAECVIMVHPQDFVTDDVFDPAKYENFTTLLALLSNGDYKCIRFKDALE